MSAPSTFEKIRDNLAGRFAWLDGRGAEVLDVVADVHMTLHNRLRGLASIVCGQHRPRQWRSILLGEDPLYLTDIVRLAMSDRREAQDAVDEALEILAEMRGYTLTPVRERAGELVPATALVGEGAGRLAAACSAALAGGHVDEQSISMIEQIEREVAERMNNWRASKAAQR